MQPCVDFMITPTATIPPAVTAMIVVDGIQFMQRNGFDAKANDGQYGLGINWHYGTDPLQIKFDAAWKWLSGATTTGSPGRPALCQKSLTV
jgi:hypothetical protein